MTQQSFRLTIAGGAKIGAPRSLASCAVELATELARHRMVFVRDSKDAATVAAFTRGSEGYGVEVTHFGMPMPESKNPAWVYSLRQILSHSGGTNP